MEYSLIYWIAIVSIPLVSLRGIPNRKSDYLTVLELSDFRVLCILRGLAIINLKSHLWIPFKI